MFHLAEVSRAFHDQRLSAPVGLRVELCWNMGYFGSSLQKQDGFRGYEVR